MRKFTSKVVAYLEDDPMQRARISKWLSNHGYLCHAFDTAADIQANLSIFEYDAVLLDWQLDSGSSGLDVLAHLRSNYSKQLPVLFLSSKNAPEEIKAVLNAGANDYLTKPVAKNELLSVLDGYLQSESRQSGVIAYGEYAQDTINQRITFNSEAINLSRCEYELAAHLFCHAGKIVRQEQLFEIIQIATGIASSRKTISTVQKLKISLRLRESTQWQLYSVQSHGYRLLRCTDTKFAA